MKYYMLIGWLIGILGTVRAQSIPVLDPSRAIDTSFSALFEDAEIIPLETSRASVFGIVKQLLVTNQYFIILDPDTDAVLFFDKNGRFVTKYKNKQSRYRINFIRLDPAHHALLIFSQNENYNISATKLQAYLEKGPGKELPGLIQSTRLYLGDILKLRSEELPPYAYWLANPVSLDSNHLAYSVIKSNPNNKDTLDHQIHIVTGNKWIKSFFPYSIKKDSAFSGSGAVWQCSFSATLNDSVFLMTRPFDSIIYALTPSSVTERYKVVAPVQETNEMSFGTGAASFFVGDMPIMSAPGFGPGRTGASVVFNTNNIRQVFSLEPYLFFSINKSFAYDYFIYNRINHCIYKYKELSPDSSNYMFPPTGAILAADQSGIYQSVTARSLFRKRKNAAKSKWKYQASLTRFYNTAKETDNPVLIRVKPKEQQDLQ
ncbi:6-bladed beta-propeller [Niabella sp. CJ426]|uniref:6-bladed beta-propeller n=1 Tax=Niabella sp. CJ426 TaxID=3393740 RepID=UPI003D070439